MATAVADCVTHHIAVERSIAHTPLLPPPPLQARKAFQAWHLQPTVSKEVSQALLNGCLRVLNNV